MVIQEIMQQMASATHPIARALHKGDGATVLAMCFKKGMCLKTHQTPVPATLLVLRGKLSYQQQGQLQTISRYESVAIPPHINHEVEATEDSLCLLIQG